MLQSILQLDTVHGCRQSLKVAVKSRESNMSDINFTGLSLLRSALLVW